VRYQIAQLYAQLPSDANLKFFRRPGVHALMVQIRGLSVRHWALVEPGHTLSNRTANVWSWKKRVKSKHDTTFGKEPR